MCGLSVSVWFGAAMRARGSRQPGIARGAGFASAVIHLRSHKGRGALLFAWVFLAASVCEDFAGAVQDRLVHHPSVDG